MDKPPKTEPKVTDSTRERGMRPTFNSAKERLKKLYGVDQLTTIEAARLWNIVEEVIKDGLRYEQIVKDSPEDKTIGQNMFALHEEAVARWLNYLYNYRIDDIPSTYVIDGKYKCKNRLELDRKLDELRKKGEKTFTIETIPTEEFKQYFKKVREEAHQLYFPHVRHVGN